MVLNKDVFERGRDNWDDYNVNDCIEETFEAFYAYKDYDLINGIIACFNAEKPQRYPIKVEGMRAMSRDHIIYGFMAFIHSGFTKYGL